MVELASEAAADPLLRRESFEIDAKQGFENQLLTTRDASMALGKELKHLHDLQNTGSEWSEQEKEDFQNKTEHIQGALACFRGISQMLQMKDITIANRYDDLDPGKEKDELIRIYKSMTRIAERMEANIYKLLGVENSWFSAQYKEYRRWIGENPLKASTIVGCCAGFLSGALALLSEHGFHLFQAVGLTQSALTVGHCALIGGVAGFVVGIAILAAVNYANSYYAERYLTADSKNQMQRVNQMVEQLKAMPDTQFLQELENFQKICNKLSDTIPDHDDRICNICLSEGREVEAPLKTPGCLGMHFMCKNHWHSYLQRCGTGVPKCPVCRQWDMQRSIVSMLSHRSIQTEKQMRYELNACRKKQLQKCPYKGKDLILEFSRMRLDLSFLNAFRPQVCQCDDSCFRQSWRLKCKMKKYYFTSSDPHHDILKQPG